MEINGLEQDCGVKSGDEPRAPPQPAHTGCKLLPRSTASSSEDSSLILCHLPAQDNPFFTAATRYAADTALGTSLGFLAV